VVIGAAVSVAVDAFITTQVNHEKYSWGRAAVAATAGGLAGGIGAAVIVPLAAAAGATAGALAVVPVSAVPAVEAGTALVTGATLSAEVNIFIASGQRTANAALEGENVTFETYRNNVRENWSSDAVYGAAGYTIGSTLGTWIDDAFPITRYGINSQSWQRYGIASMQGLSQAVSNSSLLELPAVSATKAKVRAE